MSCMGIHVSHRGKIWRQAALVGGFFVTGVTALAQQASPATSQQAPLQQAPLQQAPLQQAPLQQPSKNEIADKVERTLREAKYLEIAGTVQQFYQGNADPSRVVGGLEPVRFHAHMAPGRLHTEVFKDGVLIAAFSLFNGRCQEYRPAEKDRPLFEFDAPYVNGAAETVSTSPLDCLFASETISWVGVPKGSVDIPAMDKAASMAAKIAEGQQEADMRLGSRDCWVFRRNYHATDKNGEQVGGADLVYVDKATCLPVRWETFHHQGIHRVRNYETIRALESAPADFHWTIEVNAAVGAASAPQASQGK